MASSAAPERRTASIGAHLAASRPQVSRTSERTVASGSASRPSRTDGNTKRPRRTLANTLPCGPGTTATTRTATFSFSHHIVATRSRSVNTRVHIHAKTRTPIVDAARHIAGDACPASPEDIRPAGDDAPTSPTPAGSLGERVAGPPPPDASLRKAVTPGRRSSRGAPFDPPARRLGRHS